MADILILGGGFGGLITAERLSKLLEPEHQITLVSPNPKFTFYPALVHLAFGDCEPDDITFDLAEKLKELGVRFIRGEAINIKANHKRVQVAGKDINGDISYDYLVIALGRRLATEKVPGFYEYAHHLLETKAAMNFGEELRTFQKGKIIVGMSPQSFLPIPACETAFALAKKFRQEIEDEKISVMIFFPESIEEAFGGAKIHRELTEAFEKHNIFVTTNFPVKEISEKEIIAKDSKTIQYDMLMLLPPFRGQSFLSNIEVPDGFEFIVTDEFMRVPYFANTYAVGDIVNFSGPKLAQMAVRQAQVAAENIVAEIKGQEPKEYYYHEIAAIIDQGGADSIYLHYGIWDKSLYRLKKGRFWGWVKKIHNKLWRTMHEG
jgi:sulfide:quinone oxidoreductase